MEQSSEAQTSSNGLVGLLSMMAFATNPPRHFAGFPRSVLTPSRSKANIMQIVDLFEEYGEPKKEQVPTQKKGNSASFEEYMAQREPKEAPKKTGNSPSFADYMASTSSKKASSKPGNFDEYEASLDPLEVAMQDAEYRKSISLMSQETSEFDGGDSGSGVVGDGNRDLEDCHNSVTDGALRDGIAQIELSRSFSGGGRVYQMETMEDLPNEDHEFKGDSGAKSRERSAGANYYGRTTGYRDKLVEKGMHYVRAQQMENWMNQRALHEAKVAQEGGQKARGQISGAFQEKKEGKKGWMDVRAEESDVDWGEATEKDGDLQEPIKMKSSVGGISTTKLSIKNIRNAFSDYAARLTPDSYGAFEISPRFGKMNRKSGGEPVELVIKYRPGEPAVNPHEATLVFETEDFKRVWKLTGRT